MKKTSAKSAEYRIEERQGPAHGGLYELEQKFYLEVVENATNTVVMTFESEACATLQGPGWGEFERSGVEKVELSPDEKSVIVYSYGKHQPKRVDLPRGNIK